MDGFYVGVYEEPGINSEAHQIHIALWFGFGKSGFSLSQMSLRVLKENRYRSITEYSYMVDDVLCASGTYRS